MGRWDTNIGEATLKYILAVLFPLLRHSHVSHLHSQNFLVRGKCIGQPSFDCRQSHADEVG